MSFLVKCCKYVGIAVALYVVVILGYIGTMVPCFIRIGRQLPPLELQFELNAIEGIWDQILTNELIDLRESCNINLYVYKYQIGHIIHADVVQPGIPVNIGPDTVRVLDEEQIAARLQNFEKLHNTINDRIKYNKRFKIDL